MINKGECQNRRYIKRFERKEIIKLDFNYRGVDAAALETLGRGLLESLMKRTQISINTHTHRQAQEGQMQLG